MKMIWATMTKRAFECLCYMSSTLRRVWEHPYFIRHLSVLID